MILVKPLFRAFLACMLLAGSSAYAGIINYTFNGITDATPGSLPGEAYSGTFSFDDATLTNLGSEQISLSSLSMVFLGNTFDETGTVSTPLAIFEGGVFTGLDFQISSIDPTFGLVAGSTDVSDAYFAYVPVIDDSGFGDVNYQQVSVPEPISLVLLGFGLVAMYANRKKA